jgi:hypothetical protein
MLEPPQAVLPWQYQLVVRTFVPFHTFALGFHGDGRGFSTSSAVTYRTGLFLVFDIKSGRIVEGPIGHSTGTVGPDPLKRLVERAWASVTARIREHEGAPYRMRIYATLAGSNPLTPGSPNIDTDLHFTAFVKDQRLFVAGRVIGESFPNTEVFIRDFKDSGYPLLQFATKRSRYAPFLRLWGPGLADLGSFREAIQLDENGGFIGSAMWRP